MGSVAFCPSSGGLLFGCTAAARGFGKGILEFTATAAFGFDVRSPRFVAITARSTKAHAEASPSCTSVADDSWNGQKTTPCQYSWGILATPSVLPAVVASHGDRFSLLCIFSLLGHFHQQIIFHVLGPMYLTFSY